MNRNGQRGPSAAPRRPRRRALLLPVEPLESRALLSTAADTIITPAVAVVTADAGRGGAVTGVTVPSPVATALTPAQVARAYGLSLSAASGAGTTVAIVDAYNDPNIQADLAAFDATYGLPAASLTVLNQSGGTSNLPTTDAGWSLEAAMDVEWAHAAAPGARIVLVESRSAGINDLMTAVQTASRVSNVVSMSWGGSEFAGESAYDTTAYFANPNVTFVAATGDDAGASGAQWPASSPYVVSVGGTSLSLSGSGAYGSETAWSASGSARSGYSGSAGGVSAVEAMPSYQVTALGSRYATGRVTPDVSLVANPSTGVSVYDTVAGTGQIGWFQGGGTSAGSPVWAGLVAAADSARAANRLGSLGSSQTLSLLYALYGTAATNPPSYGASFHDVTSGVNFAGYATTGYDKVTGLGSPIASHIILAASQFGLPTTVKAATASAAVTVTTAAHATAHAQAVVPVTGPVTTTTVSTAAAPPVVSPVSVPTTITVSPPTPATSGQVTVAVVAAPSAPAPPAQTAATIPSLSVVSSDDEVLPPPPEVRTAPGVDLESVDPQEGGETAPAPAPVDPPITPGPLGWDLALERYVMDGPGSTDAEPLPAVETPTRSRPGAALTGSLALAGWGAWEFRSRRSDRDRRRSALRALGNA